MSALAVAMCGVIVAASIIEDPKPDANEFIVPYTLTGTKHVMVRVKLNGKGPYNFIVDTGAPSIFLAKRVAQTLKLKTDSDGWSMFNTFEIEGGLKPKNVKALTEDLFQLDGINSLGLAGHRIDGVIGYNLLARYRITYDFSDDVLLWKPLEFTPPAVERIGGGGQGSLEILGPITKLMAGLLGIKPTFDVRPRGFLGIEIEETKNGVAIRSVFPHSPAAKGRLQANDIIHKIGIPSQGKFIMKRIDDKRDLTRLMNSVLPDSELQFQYSRDEKSYTTIIRTSKGY